MAARFVEGPVSDFVKTCVNVPRFLGYCRACQNYGHGWSCPPFSFSTECMWNQYSDILLCEEKVYVNSVYQNKTYTQEEANEISRSILALTKKRMVNDLLALEREYPDSMALFPGNCDLCPICARELGEQCYHPSIMRYSIESLGGDVTLAVRIYFDDRLLWVTDGHLPEYFILLGGILKHKK